MKDNLQDLIQYTFGLSNIDLIKVTGTDKQTLISAVAEDKTLIIEGTFHTPLADFIGVFGMPNLGKLKTILSFGDIYDSNAKINVERNNEDAPTNIHFETKTGNFVSDYRLMAKSIVEEKVKNVTFRGATWDVTFEPSIEGITYLKKQALVNNEETTFVTKTEGTNLRVYFGDASTHSGNAVFQSNIKGSLKRSWQWPVKVFLSIMDLPGNKTVNISDSGVAEITVDSGLSTYRYLLPAQSK